MSSNQSAINNHDRSRTLLYSQRFPFRDHRDMAQIATMKRLLKRRKLGPLALSAVEDYRLTYLLSIGYSPDSQGDRT